MRWLLSILLVLTGCAEPLGPKDEDAALEVVYDAQGVPAFAGQALIIQGCGAGAYCHAEASALDRRYGAPAGLDFDLRVASIGEAPQIEAAERLERDQLRIIAMRHSVWEQVQARAMPPGGAVGRAYAELTAHVRFERVAADGVTFRPLPGLDSEEGRALLRVWLASGAPVVERTEPRSDGEPSVTGFLVAPCARTCVDPTWESIHAAIVAPSCASSACHGGEAPEGALDLTGEPGAVLERIRGAPSEGALCAASGVPILTPGSPERSLLFVKMAATSSSEVCGTRMPPAGSPPGEQALCAIEAWIRCGACGTGDASCDACVDEARASCGVTIEGGAPRCGAPSACPSRP